MIKIMISLPFSLVSAATATHQTGNDNDEKQHSCHNDNDDNVEGEGGRLCDEDAGQDLAVLDHTVLINQWRVLDK